MANKKLWVASVNGMPRPRPPEGQSTDPAAAASSPAGPLPEEGLRLIRAFSRIADPSRRAQLIEELEKVSRT